MNHICTSNKDCQDENCDSFLVSSKQNNVAKTIATIDTSYRGTNTHTHTVLHHMILFSFI